MNQKEFEAALADFEARQKHGTGSATGSASADICKPVTSTSSSWSGYYTHNSANTPMTFDMTFNPDGSVSGSGSDKIGDFTWSGSYAGKEVDVTKQYTGKHSVEYKGTLVKEEGKVVFSGQWTLGQASDAFKMTETTTTMTVGDCGVPNFSDAVNTEIGVAEAYADEVIPPGGQRRLLAATGSAEDFAAEEAHTKEEIEALNATLHHDHEVLEDAQLKASAAVNATGNANIALTNAEDAFKTAHADEQDNDNNARLHASHAALVESKVKATDSYVGTHRGALHQTSCAEEKKFAFDVCFGRNAYKGQLLQTGKAKESRAKADMYKKKMGKDYAIVLKSNATLISDEEAEHAAELLVQNMTAKLNEDGDKLMKAETEYKSEVAEQKAAEAKAAAAAEEAAAAAAAAGGPGAAAEEASADADAGEAVADAAPTGSAAGAPIGMYEAESALYAELLEEEPEYTHEAEDEFIDTESIVPETANRKLLTTDPRHGPDVEGKCLESTNAAFNTCEKDVDGAYAACTKIYNTIARL